MQLSIFFNRIARRLGTVLVFVNNFLCSVKIMYLYYVDEQFNGGCCVRDREREKDRQRERERERENK